MVSGQAPDLAGEMAALEVMPGTDQQRLEPTVGPAVGILPGSFLR
jgi:hypothetical protein